MGVRAAASAAAVLITGGAAAVTTAVIAGPGSAWTGYVSEAGIGSDAHASAYRMGILGLAAGLALLAAAVAPMARVAAALLAAGSVGAAVSGAVTCSDGCPLPPFEDATGADLVHGGTSIAAVAACVFAMVAMRGASLIAAAVALPLSAAVGLAMVFAGRGALVGLLERALLATIAAWLITVAFTAGSGRMESRR